ncbi:hypothetical protein GCM10027072_27000 [Streptomyces bullii]
MTGVNGARIKGALRWPVHRISPSRSPVTRAGRHPQGTPMLFSARSQPLPSMGGMIVPHTSAPAASLRPVRKAVVPAAGLGTRFLPATKATPKEMLPVVDKPAIQYVVEEAAAAGLDDVLLVTGRHKRAIEDHFGHAFELEQTLAAKGDTIRLDAVRDPARLAHVHHVRQGDPLGRGHAVLCARRHVGDEPFAAPSATI